MKKRSTLAALLFAGIALAAGTADAQQAAPPKSSADVVREAVRVDKRALVEKNMQLTPEEAKKFWPLYDAYQKDLERIMSRENRAIIDYVESEATMTDANAKRIANEVVAANGEEQKLRERTLKKLLGALPARKAARYLQIEAKIRAVYRYDVAERIPLVR